MNVDQVIDKLLEAEQNKGTTLTDPSVPGWSLVLPEDFSEENNIVKIINPSGVYQMAALTTDNGGMLVVPGTKKELLSKWTDPAWAIYNNQF